MKTLFAFAALASLFAVCFSIPMPPPYLGSARQRNQQSQQGTKSHQQGYWLPPYHPHQAIAEALIMAYNAGVKEGRQQMRDKYAPYEFNEEEKEQADDQYWGPWILESNEQEKKKADAQYGTFEFNEEAKEKADAQYYRGPYAQQHPYKLAQEVLEQFAAGLREDSPGK